MWGERRRAKGGGEFAVHLLVHLAVALRRLAVAVVVVAAAAAAAVSFLLLVVSVGI